MVYVFPPLCSKVIIEHKLGHSSIPFQCSIPPFHSTDSKHPIPCYYLLSKVFVVPGCGMLHMVVCVYANIVYTFQPIGTFYAIVMKKEMQGNTMA